MPLKKGKAPAMTLPEGTVVQVGDKVRARGETGCWSVCVVLDIWKERSVTRALLTAGEKYTGRRSDFGTVILTLQEIKPHQARPDQTYERGISREM